MKNAPVGSEQAAMSSDIFSSEDKNVVTLDYARRMLHISKRKCADLLRKGIMPYQAEMKQVFRKGYCTDYLEYVCTDSIGRLYSPDFVSEHFSLLLKKNGMEHIRFHELRHSCASLLLSKKVPMKMIQEWLGHSDISTTSNIYSHLDA